MKAKNTSKKKQNFKPIRLSKKGFTLISLFLVSVLCIELYFVSKTDSNISKNEQTEVKSSNNPTTKISDNKPSSTLEETPQNNEALEGTNFSINHNNLKIFNNPNNNENLELPAIYENNNILHNKDGRYTVCYSSKDKQPYWVAYTLTSEDMSKKEAKRKDNFRPDPAVYSNGLNTADVSDYKGSNYDRGHLVPSADRDNSQAENDATFLFSNISPQAKNLNRFVWSALENEVRKLATKHEVVYIATGGVLNYNTDAPIKVIGDSVTVPEMFYKVLLIESGNNYYSIGYLMPNSEDCGRNYKEYAVTVDSIEKVTNLDFFYSLDDEIENKVESYIDQKFWD